MKKNHQQKSQRSIKSRTTLRTVALVAVALLPAVMAAAPATQPAATPGPVTVAPTTAAPATAVPTTPQSTRSNTSNYNNNRSDRTSRRNRGYGNSGSVSSAAYSSTTAITDQILALQTRSIFIKGNQTVAAADSSPRPRPQPTGFGVGRPESSLVFNGVTVTDSETNAMIEDLSSHKVNTVHPGDPIAGGKVSAITFDDLTYEVGGSAKHVAIGQTLDGVDAVFNDSGSSPAPTSTGPAPTTPPSSGNQQTTGGPPPAAAGTPIPSGASQEDILTRMKARRAAEAAGK